jgi:hypothetical protein
MIETLKQVEFKKIEIQEATIKARHIQEESVRQVWEMKQKFKTIEEQAVVAEQKQIKADLEVSSIKHIIEEKIKMTPVVIKTKEEIIREKEEITGTIKREET